MSDLSTFPNNLEALEARLRQDLAWLELPAKSWVPPRIVDGQAVVDVVIIGAGMAGLVASAMLKRLGVANHIVLDKAPAGREGPWVTFARMRTLRSPKQLTGPAMGLPALTFRAYYEALHGRDAWVALDRAPRETWMDYLVWYRRVLDLPVRNGVAVDAIRPRADGLLDVVCRHDGRSETMIARHVVLATGRDGLGGPFVPSIAHGIERKFWAHTAAPIDFHALRGKRVGVVGAGASAMDNAATALEAGASRLDLFVRRTDLPRINKFTGIGSQGVVHGFAGLPDDWKWRFLDYAMRAQTPPPRPSVLRVSAFPQAHLHLKSPIDRLQQEGDHIVVTTPKGSYPVDILIFGTGFKVELTNRPELAAVASHIRLWRDRFPVPADMRNDELETSPDLGEAFEFLEAEPGACPALARIHCFNFPATLSHGKLTGDIPAISEGADRLARGIVRALFVADRERHFADLQAFDTPELLGDEWADDETATFSDLSAERTPTRNA
ncbi:NAD(P)/FAD-dependent oxidoreductase [Rhizobium leguminosarum]|uniref:NAD(P)-binding domain-containing protein n=1 Tax=Rhizobium TaxID=379 RepID=UPI001031B2D2|nr:NAD(P)/FAD-dependent oxidoreductase [Rhizobium leguminosarum]MBY5374984.1 NAD(P)/FAD-dependent oxidoreductase [Rhizobium leguminosarum]TBG02862.1 NAD(P)/FAD-dependent oxidoreductase [Rhizobium leguminosarum]TBG19689.1 NAD(P)/FAD-dependent oxidoreductase [Rhizobium leguminosarum]TBG36170.1 NAD(P)/FAD-dependent oxidoreductase [Rhizobium leguminosarum]TBG45607.1 NAD(P)/FAD-dependent oxidoreductase [Rhizobium leguminosarum]